MIDNTTQNRPSPSPEDLEIDGATRISQLARIAHRFAESRGWHNKRPLEYLALIGSEVGEAVNECRALDPDEKLGTELADIVIRVMDFAVELDIDIEAKIKDKMKLNFVNGNLKGRLK